MRSPRKPVRFNTAISTVETVGSILVQLGWRKWGGEHTQAADDALINDVFEALQDGRFDTVRQMCSLGRGIKTKEDASARILCVNHAVVLRERKQLDEMEKVLAEFDWSAASQKFQIALTALRGQEKEFLRLLPKVMTAEELEYGNLDTWPLFKCWRDQPWYESAIARYKRVSPNAPKKSVTSIPRSRAGLSETSKPPAVRRSVPKKPRVVRRAEKRSSKK